MSWLCWHNDVCCQPALAQILLQAWADECRAGQPRRWERMAGGHSGDWEGSFLGGERWDVQPQDGAGSAAAVNSISQSPVPGLGALYSLLGFAAK